jgi:hypothetical protein
MANFHSQHITVVTIDNKQNHDVNKYFIPTIFGFLAPLNAMVANG